MTTHNYDTLTIITPDYLSTLDKSQLVDLLQHKTQLLIAARTGGIKYPNYINGLKKEVELIQSEIGGRDDSLFGRGLTRI